jgi:hypothetical protein
MDKHLGKPYFYYMTCCITSDMTPITGWAGFHFESIHTHEHDTGNPTPLAQLFILGTAIFWMYVGWRAMEAHERLARATEDMARKMREREDQPSRVE